MARTTAITGGTTGIGAALARMFHSNGDHVLIAARTDNGLAAELGPRARFQHVDATIPASHAALADAALSWTGRLDVYINNAGRSHWMPLEQVTEAFWQEMLDVNLKSTLFGSQQAAARMGRGACILNISSMAVRRDVVNPGGNSTEQHIIRNREQAPGHADLREGGCQVDAHHPYDAGLIRGRDVEQFLAVCLPCAGIPSPGRNLQICPSADERPQVDLSSSRFVGVKE